jgi:xanthine dehydrogenase accessory factor
MRAARLWSEVVARLEAGQRAALTMVVANSPHSPGKQGASMAVWEDGTRLGTIGGGAMELAQLDASRAALANLGAAPAPTLRELVHRSSGPGERSGMICAGQQTNVTLVLEPARHLDALRGAARLLAADEPGRLIISHTGELEVTEGDALEPWCAIAQDADGWQVTQQLLASRRVAIFGAGHCGLALAQQMAALDYVVTVADSRPNLDTLEELRAGGWADHIVLDSALSHTAAAVRWPAISAAIIMTVSYPQDVEALAGVLRAPFPFIGLMGAPAKLARIRAALTERGFGPEDLARITAPVGLPIGSETPAEIAVSVAAQLLSLRR